MNWILLSAALLAADPAAAVPDTIVVCPREMRDALRPWVEYRQGQGRRFAFLENNGSAEQIREGIRKLASGGKIRWLVLVGDADRTSAASPRGPQTPTHYAKAKVNIHWGSEPTIATDNPFADLDNDRLPDLAVGRLSADTPAQLSVVVRKIIDYEQSDDFGLWRRRINFIAGVGGFGAIADTALEMTTKKFLTTEIPHGYQTSMTYGSWRSAYCPDPRDFHDVTVQRHNEGCLFWVYIGHGQRRFLDFVRVPGRHYGILNVGEVGKLKCQHRPPIAIFLACYTGAYDEPRDCLAEEMLRAPGGPIAVYSGSRVTMPYAMACMSHAMLQQHFEKKRETLGEIIQFAKRRMAAKLTDEEASKDPSRQLLDKLALAISPAKNMLDEERAEHLSLFNLLGDPLLRVPQPRAVEIRAPDEARAGEQLEVSGASSIDGDVTVELAYRRDRTRRQAPSRFKFDPSNNALTAYNASYRIANDPVVARHETTTKDGRFQAVLKIPEAAYGACHVRIHVRAAREFALGATKLFVRMKSKER